MARSVGAEWCLRLGRPAYIVAVRLIITPAPVSQQLLWYQPFTLLIGHLLWGKTWGKHGENIRKKVTNLFVIGSPPLGASFGSLWVVKLSRT